MASPRVDDLRLHVTLTSLQSHARGWSFCINRVEPGGDDANSTSIWGATPDGQVTRLVADGSGPAWATDGHCMAYLGDAGGSREVMLYDAQTRDTRQVSQLDGSIASIEQLDPARGRMLVLRRQALQDGPDTPFAVDFLPLKQDGLGPAGQEAVRLGTVDLASGDYTACVDDGGDVLEARWDPAARLLAWIQRRGGTQRHAMDVWLREVDAGAAPPRRLGDGLVSISSLCWSPDSTRLALAASSIEGDSITWLHIIEVESGRQRCLDIELGTPAAIQWDAHGEYLLVSEARRGLQRIVIVPPEGEVRTLYDEEQVQVQEIAANGRAVGFTAFSSNGGPEFWIIQGEDEVPRQVTAFNAWRADRITLDVERRHFQVPDGTGAQARIDGWLVLPEGKGPFPLLLNIHGGPQVPASLAYEKAVHVPVLVERGWAVLGLNAVGSSTYGVEFARRLRGRWGELDWPQWQAAVKQLQDEDIASGTVAVFGHSYGGFLAAWAAAHDDSLACAVVSAGVINLESHTGTSDTGYYVGPYAMDGELPDQRARYRELSPVSHAHRTRAPVLILQGTEDQRCPVGQAEELFSTLVRHAQVPARLLRFPGGDHHVAITGPVGHRCAYYQALVNWLEQWRHASAQRRDTDADGRQTHARSAGADSKAGGDTTDGGRGEAGTAAPLREVAS